MYQFKPWTPVNTSSAKQNSTQNNSINNEQMAKMITTIVTALLA